MIPKIKKPIAIDIYCTCGYDKITPKLTEEEIEDVLCQDVYKKAVLKAKANGDTLPEYNRKDFRLHDIVEVIYEIDEE